jgi:hypothetical protein
MEAEMLNLKLSDAKRPLVVETRKKSGREVVLDGIMHQIELLKDPSYKVERSRYIKGDDGNSRQTIARPPKPWFWLAADGTKLVQVKYGHSSVVEIEPGKPSVICGKTDKDVITVLGQVADAVRAGSLDSQIDIAKSKAKRSRNGKSE